MAKNTSSGATRLSDLSDGKQDILKIDPKIIVVGKDFNYRDFKLSTNKEHVKDTRRSIAVNGVLNPLWVHFDPATKLPHLVAGETRLRSVLEILADPTVDDEVKARVARIPVIQKKGDVKSLLLQSLQENTQKPPSKWEVGNAYRRLQDDHGMTTADIALAMGQSAKYVQEALDLKDAPPEIKQMLSEASVSPAHALWTMKKHGGNATAVLQLQVKAARAQADAKKAAKEEKKAADKKGGKKSKGGRPAKAEKPVTVKREKKAGGRFITDDVLKLVTSALKAAAQSENVDISMTADSALEALEGKAKE